MLKDRSNIRHHDLDWWDMHVIGNTFSYGDLLVFSTFQLHVVQHPCYSFSFALSHTRFVTYSSFVEASRRQFIASSTCSLTKFIPQCTTYLYSAHESRKSAIYSPGPVIVSIWNLRAFLFSFTFIRCHLFFYFSIFLIFPVFLLVAAYYVSSILLQNDFLECGCCA